MQAAKRGQRGMGAPTPPFLLFLTAPLPPPAYVGNADMIQPDLTPLQPSLDDFMEISGGAGPSPWVGWTGRVRQGTWAGKRGPGHWSCRLWEFPGKQWMLGLSQGL